jgi:hypothetical protein
MIVGVVLGAVVGAMLGLGACEALAAGDAAAGPQPTATDVMRQRAAAVRTGRRSVIIS